MYILQRKEQRWMSVIEISRQQRGIHEYISLPFLIAHTGIQSVPCINIASVGNPLSGLCVSPDAQT